jgi:hypothetical protein
MHVDLSVHFFTVYPRWKNGWKTKIRLINILMKMQTMMILCLLDLMDVVGYKGNVCCVRMTHGRLVMMCAAAGENEGCR